MPVSVRGGTALAVVLALGCGSAQFDGSTYHGEGFTFRVPRPPSAWERVNVEGGGLAFRDPANAATIAVNGRCGDKDDDVPLAALTQHLFLMFTDREIQKQDVVPFDGREAMHTVLTAKLDGVPKTFDVWVLKKDGCVYDLYYIAQPERYGMGVSAFQGFVRGFSAAAAHAD
jgi:hypothetical protein